jgi:hypothetical protein
MTNRIILTADIANASGTDAGNMSMRRAGRERWNEDDLEIACLTTNRLMLYIPLELGGLRGVPVPMLLNHVDMDDIRRAGIEIPGDNQ